MKLKVQQLQNVVNTAREAERVAGLIREEIRRTTSSAIIVEERAFSEVCDEMLEHIEVAQSTGRPLAKWNTSVLLKMTESTAPKLRHLSALLLPESQLYRLMSDRNPDVRSAVARRISLKEAAAMVKRFPADEVLRRTVDLRLEDFKKVDDTTSLYDKKRLGAIAKTHELELGDAWYDSFARKIVLELGGDIYHYGTKRLADRYVASVKSLSGKDIDKAKLYEALDALIEDYEDTVLARAGLKESINTLGRQAINEAQFCVYESDEDAEDPLEALVERRASSMEYMAGFETLFSVTSGVANRSAHRGMLAEGIDVKGFSMPRTASLPHDGQMRRLDERALDIYCEHWNRRHTSSEHSPVKIDWLYDGDSISFKASV